MLSSNIYLLGTQHIMMPFEAYDGVPTFSLAVCGREAFVFNCCEDRVPRLPAPPLRRRNAAILTDARIAIETRGIASPHLSPHNRDNTASNPPWLALN